MNSFTAYTYVVSLYCWISIRWMRVIIIKGNKYEQSIYKA